MRNLILNIEAMALRSCPSGRLASFHTAMKRQRDARKQEQEQESEASIYVSGKTLIILFEGIQLMLIQKCLTDHFNVNECVL